MKQSIYRLKPAIQNYAWGKLGRESLVGKLCGAAKEDTAPYAELWLGAHPKAPALAEVNSSSTSLDQLIDELPEITTSAGFSYLFKILSIREALSIQVHPDKETAVKLHKSDPENYPDENHKPEVAIAITPVTMLYGFRSEEDISSLVSNCPELEKLLEGKDIKSLKKTFTKIVKTPSLEAKALQESFLDRTGAKTDLTPEELWTRKLCLQYKNGDAGTFLPFVMNLFVLKKGQGLYTEANIPHAYLDGDLVECMANSDNVVRAALTPKYRDVETLLKITNFTGDAPNTIETVEIIESVQEYQTPSEEFSIYRVDKSEETKVINFSSGPRILMSYKKPFTVETNDSSELIEPGQAALIPAFIDEFSISNSESECWIASS